MATSGDVNLEIRQHLHQMKTTLTWLEERHASWTLDERRNLVKLLRDVHKQVNAVASSSKSETEFHA